MTPKHVFKNIIKVSLFIDPVIFGDLTAFKDNLARCKKAKIFKIFMSQDVDAITESENC